MAQQPATKEAPAAVPVPQPTVPVDVLNDFRRILGLMPDDAIPAALEQLYLRYAKMVDVCSAGRITPKELILLAVLSSPVPAAPAAGRPAMNSTVSALFGGKMTTGKLVGAEPENAKVQFAGDTENFRRIKWADVKPA
jgi:hypothetical protein